MNTPIVILLALCLFVVVVPEPAAADPPCVIVNPPHGDVDPGDCLPPATTSEGALEG